MALVATSVSSGSALAASQPTAKTKAQWRAAIARVQQPGAGCFHASYPALQWHAVKCMAAPRVPLAPVVPGSARHGGPETVGDGHDYSAQVSGLISKGVGTFTNVSSNITEKGKPGGSGSAVANAFSLQLNSQFFTGSPACSGSGTPSQCEAWQQFVYTYQNKTTGFIFMQYWLINYNATCPSGWFTFSTDCYTNSNATKTPGGPITAKELATTSLTGTAKAGGKDSVAVSLGSGQAASVTGQDTKIHLAAAWNTTEWGVYGDGGGSAANFGANTSLEAVTTLTDTSGGAPTCVKEGFTGETNNLKLAKTPALGSEPSPTMASKQTNGTAGVASCQVAA